MEFGFRLIYIVDVSFIKIFIKFQNKYFVKMVRVFVQFCYERDIKKGVVKLIYIFCLYFQLIVEICYLYIELGLVQELYLKDLVECMFVI